MPSRVPSITVNESALLSATSGAIAVGDVLIDDATTGDYVKATTANRGTRRAHGLALSAYGSTLRGSVRMQTGGIVPTEVTGLGAGSVSWVRTSSTGACERCTPASGDDLLGKCDANGNLFLDPGKWDSSNYAGGGGGGGGGGTPGGSSGDVQYNNAGAFGGIAPSTSGNLLQSNGSAWASTAPSFAATVITSGTIGAARGGTGLDTSGSSGVLKVTAGTWATITLGTGVETFLTTPSGANLASALTTALPDSKGGTGLTSLGTGVATWLGTPSGANLATALTTALPATKGGTGLTSLGTNVATWLGTPSGANLASALTTSLPNTKGGTGQDSSAWTGLASVSAGTWSQASVGTGVLTFLATPSSANLRSALTDETGTGAAVFATDPAITNTSINNATSGGTINNCTLSGTSGFVRRVRFTDATGPTVTGFDATGVADGTLLRVTAAGGTVAVTHEDAGSTAANRVILQGGITIGIAAGVWTEFMYDATSSRWRHSGATAI